MPGSTSPRTCSPTSTVRCSPPSAHASVPIEWGVPWTGVDPYADSLVQPVIDDGMMAPLPEEAGLRQPARRRLGDVATTRRSTSHLRLVPTKGGPVNIQRSNDFNRRRFLDPIRCSRRRPRRCGVESFRWWHTVRRLRLDGAGNGSGRHVRPDALRRPDRVDSSRRRRARRPRAARQARRDQGHDGDRRRGVDARPRRSAGEQQSEPAGRPERLRHRPHPRVQCGEHRRGGPAHAIERLCRRSGADPRGLRPRRLPRRPVGVLRLLRCRGRAVRW